MDAQTIGELLRCSLGLSAWKQFRQSRWALRVNPSSGNLHPTEGYVVHAGRVLHYAPREHALEERAALARGAWDRFTGGRDGLLVALTTIHWREAWKYGERAFRYCQHDIGHAIGALRFSAALLGWHLRLLPQWPDDDLAALLGLDRDIDFGDADREEPECIAVVTPGDPREWTGADPAVLVAAARAAAWAGVANRLSPSRVEWPLIDEVAALTRRSRAGGAGEAPGASEASEADGARGGSEADEPDGAGGMSTVPSGPGPRARRIILQRRSALGFDARSSLPRAAFMSMLRRLLPGGCPWDAIDWPPHVHLLIFVHRVEGLTPGLYAFLRAPGVAGEWRAAMRPEFLWERTGPGNDPGDAAAGPASGPNGPNDLFLLVPTDVTWIANRLSCDQDIAADGFFSLAMIARVESALRTQGAWFYRRLFWEAGLLGQLLYLEAEAAGARSTGIGCFYDDPVHEMAGLSGHEWQSLYHFSMGIPVDDGRLTTEPGYPWEDSGDRR